MRAQFSLIELLLITIVLVVCIGLMSTGFNSALLIEAERTDLLYRESLINSFVSYYSPSYNETFMTLLIHYLCYKPFDLSEAVEVINMLDYENNSFILYARLVNELRLFNNQPSVCLNKLSLSTVDLFTPCGNTTLLFGLWQGEAPELC